MDVLAGVRAGHDRDLGRRQLERLDPAGLEEREQPERLDARAQRHDPVRVAEQADDPAGRRRPRRRRRGGRSRRCRCASGGRGSAGRHGGPGGDAPGGGPRGGRRDRVAVTSAVGPLGTGAEGEDTAPAGRARRRRRAGRGRGPGATMLRCPRPSRSTRRTPVSQPPVVAWPSLHVSNHPAVLHKLAILREHDDRAQEVPRDRPRAVVAARPRGAGRRPGPADHGRDAARDDRRPSSWPTGSGSSRSCAPVSAWSTRCSS